jgi:predicted phosphodiesterase
MLRFLHLSDIHFTAEDPAIHDRNTEIRVRLLEDIEARFKASTTFDAILVTGDIAFAGIAAEYVAAMAWLRSIQDSLSVDKVLCVPGNHDVDRSAHRVSAGLRSNIAFLKQSSPEEAGQLLGDLLADPLGPGHLMHPLQAYNDFAASFGCEIPTSRYVWSHELALDGTPLLIHGLCSAFSCSAKDASQNIVLGDFQARLPDYRPDAVNLTLCHHPPEWLRDHDQVDLAFLARSSIQLFGHKHMQRALQIEGTLRVVAGAVFPEGNSPHWVPSYGVLEVEHVPPNVVTRLRQFAWSAENLKFTEFWQASSGDFVRTDYLPFKGGTAPTRPHVLPLAVSPGSDLKGSSEAFERPLNELLRDLSELASLRLLVGLGQLGPGDSVDDVRDAIAKVAASEDPEEISRVRVLHQKLTDL